MMCCFLIVSVIADLTVKFIDVWMYFIEFRRQKFKKISKKEIFITEVK
jgi:hypothetical protein